MSLGESSAAAIANQGDTRYCCRRAWTHQKALFRQETSCNMTVVSSCRADETHHPDIMCEVAVRVGVVSQVSYLTYPPVAVFPFGSMHVSMRESANPRAPREERASRIFSASYFECGTDRNSAERGNLNVPNILPLTCGRTCSNSTTAGTEFVNKEVERVAKDNGFKIRKSRPFSPSTNGKVEHKVTVPSSLTTLQRGRSCIEYTLSPPVLEGVTPLPCKRFTNMFIGAAISSELITLRTLQAHGVMPLSCAHG